MDQQRRFVRIKPSAQISSKAHIITDIKAPMIECRVIDYAAGGACLELDPGKLVAKKFELLHSGTRKKCRVVWTAGRRIGVSF